MKRLFRQAFVLIATLFAAFVFAIDPPDYISGDGFTVYQVDVPSTDSPFTRMNAISARVGVNDSDGQTFNFLSGILTRNMRGSPCIRSGISC